MRLHVVSFQVPYPPRYGGLIDVYYKLKALKQSGVRLTLHTYIYGDATRQDESLRQVADEVYYYPRHTGWQAASGRLPYIVQSRRSPLLLEHLLADDAPILFEGLHTCYFLTHPRLAGRELWVRTHNVEHDYYRGLAHATPLGIKRLYYTTEALRLQRYEHVLHAATRIFAISPTDTAHFAACYPQARTTCLPCFYNNEPGPPLPPQDKQPFGGAYVLYQGNLAVEENIRAVRHIVRHVLPLVPEVRLVVAGASPSNELCNELKSYPNVILRANLSEQDMHTLIACARVNILLTFQPTGIKLKLLHALAKGRGSCLVTSYMLPDKRFRQVCHVADSADELAACLHQLYTRPTSDKQLEYRREVLKNIGYGNDVSPLLLHP